MSIWSLHCVTKFDRSVVVNLKSIHFFWLIFEKKTFQFWQENWIQVLVIFLQLYQTVKFGLVLQKVPLSICFFCSTIPLTLSTIIMFSQLWKHNYFWHNTCFSFKAAVGSLEWNSCHAAFDNSTQHQWCRNQGARGATAPPLLIFCWSVNSFPTGEGRLSPPITTGPPKFFHLPASLIIWLA